MEVKLENETVWLNRQQLAELFDRDVKKIGKHINNVHDRFLIIDDDQVYHIGASLKDLGKKLFAFSKLNISVHVIIDRL